MTTEEIKMFISQIAPIIQREARKRNYPFPSAIIAQACLESAYGTSSLAWKYHNYFGMKCGSGWTGKSVNLNTKEEYTPGVLTGITDRFRVYDTMEEGVIGYFDFINKVRYQNLRGATSSRNYLELIKADGYATSSNYVDNVYKVVTMHQLQTYDLDHSAPQTKAVDVEIVTKILQGKMGNGATRRQNVLSEGYNYDEVQKKVNEIITIAGVIKEQKKTLGEYWELALTQI